MRPKNICDKPAAGSSLPASGTGLAAVLALTVLTLTMGLAAPALAGEPPLPPGLDGLSATEEPALPPGLGGTPEPAFSPRREKSGPPFDFTGFAETRIGARLSPDPGQKNASIGEARLHAELQKDTDQLTINIAADFVFDPVLERYEVNLETGQGWLDLREANLVFSPLPRLDVKIGRQILTWGTGDLIFINDLFPKDWNAFFIGRDVNYLKAPSDAVKLAFFFDLANLDLVYTPRFDADRFIDGRRISFFNPLAGRLTGRAAPLGALKPKTAFEDDEIALRLYRNMRAYEVALYAYRGFWKSPAGADPATGLFTFPRLDVFGASARGPLGPGIAHAEFGYYDSRDDRRGTNPAVRNSEWRAVIGYEQELAHELTGGVQYYLERMSDHSAYLGTLPPGTPRLDRTRHVITVRLTKLLMNQTLQLSAFTFYSPSDDDGYGRFIARYKLTDAWQISAGINLFYGQARTTFFGQFKDASNLYAALRYGF